MANPKGTWKPGQSGNPRGRPPGKAAVTTLRESIIPHAPEIVAAMVEQAKAGDVQAARVLLERVLPPMRSIEQPQPIDLPDGSLTDQGRAVLIAIAEGALAPSQGSQLLSAIGTLAKVAELDDLERRVKALEGGNTDGGNTGGVNGPANKD